MFSIGGSGAGNYQFSGVFDDIRIYERKLSDSEVNNLTNSEHLNDFVTCAPVIESSLKEF